MLCGVFRYFLCPVFHSKGDSLICGPVNTLKSRLIRTGERKRQKWKEHGDVTPLVSSFFFLLLFLSSFIESDLLGYRSSWHDDDGRPQQCVYTYTPLSSTENQHRRSSSSFGTLGFLDTNNSIPWLLERWFTLMYRLYIYRVSLLGTQWRRRRRGIGEHCQCNPTI